MANTNLFAGNKRGKAPRTVPVNEKGEPTRNEAGGVAFEFSPKHALAQYACTGTLNNTFYATDRDQLTKMLELVKTVNDPEFLGKLAIYARKHAFMKDMPSLLVSVLFARSSSQFLASDSSVPGIKKLGHAVEADAYRRVFKMVFPIVIDNAKMLRNFVQMITSGALGRKSFGRVGLKAMQGWFAARSPDAIFRSSLGQNPTMADVIKLAHPKPKVGAEGLFPYLIGHPEESQATDEQKKHQMFYKGEQLPELVLQFEAFKRNPELPTPKVDFRMLTALDLSTAKWREIALNGRWHFVRMNLNTFQRHGVFEGKTGKDVASKLAKILTDEEQVAKSMVFPYQLFAAFKNATEIPQVLKLALQDAMELAVKNVPSLPGETYIFPDVSGSMGSPVTGHRGSATTSMTCVDIAALVASSILRTSQLAHILPVDTSLHTHVKFNPRDSIMTNTAKLARMGGGGTNLSLGLQHLVKSKAQVDTVIFITDNMSWVDRGYYSYGGEYTTGSETYWQQIKSLNPNAKLVSLMIQPYGSGQVGDEHDSVLNIGGFSDQVFTVIERFVVGDNANFWVEEIEKITLG